MQPRVPAATISNEASFHRGAGARRMRCGSANADLLVVPHPVGIITSRLLKEIRVKFAHVRITRALLVLAVAFGFAAPAGAQPTPPPPIAPQGSIVGTVVDAANGVPLPGVTVQIIGKNLKTTTDASGRFKLDSVPAGRHVLSLSRRDYQPAVSEPIEVGAATIIATLSMQRGTGNLTVIATTSTRASDSLQQSSTFTKTVNTEELERMGITRVADALRTLPGVNNGLTGDTASLSDDINLNIRGIGTLETEAAIDGHPIGYGVKGGYNYNLSPAYGLRDTTVMYGSASDLVGVDAIGGVINFQTLDPTPTFQTAITQGWGTFNQLSTSLRSTGTIGKLGYAVAWGVSYLEGVFRNDTFYQPGAAFDQSVLSGPVHDLGIYTADSAASTRGGLVKLRYNFDDQSNVTYTMYTASRWFDKTGNGDGDYLPYNTALARGQKQLASYDPSGSTSYKCPSGTFPATNALGALNGFGPNGKPDGGLTCQTPQQYAAFNTGWQGAGPAWGAFHLNDNSLTYTNAGTNSIWRATFYNSLYDIPWDRTFQLPFYTYPGSNASWRSTGVNETGFLVGDEFPGPNSDFEIGTSYMNNAYFLTTNSNHGNGVTSTGSFPYAWEQGYFARYVYHAPNSPLAGYANLWQKHASATNSTYIDSRFSVVDRATNHDIVRFSVGNTTTQPSQDMLNTTYVPNNDIIGAGGGAAITCDGLNSVGTAPSSLLQPETGVDQEVSYTHRWYSDSQTQFLFYNTNVFNKLYSTIIPLSESGTSFIPPSVLAQFVQAVGAKCGAAIAPSLLGSTGNFNVGTLRAKGWDFSGRLRASRDLYFDYDWALTSTVLLGANTQLVQANTTLIPFSQLARVPLHTANLAADYTIGHKLDLRYGYYWVSEGNTKSLPAYDYSDLSAAYPVKNGVITATLLNVWNQYAFLAGLIGNGVPLPLNQYATQSKYQPYIGTAATEQFGLPSRSIYFSYQILLNNH
jgi:outer membrane receptor protein involved in Fe transport